MQYFSECMESLAAQTNKNFKVYIGDDASPEDPLEIIEGFRDSLSIFYHRFNENLGGTALTRQWHRCVDLSASEKWLMILGDDDYLSSNYVEEFYKNLKEVEDRNIKVVHFGSRVIRSPSGEISKLYKHPKIEKSTDFFFRKFLDFSRGSLTEQIFRRDAYNKHGFRNFPLGWGADNFAWLDFTEFGEIYSINSATAYFRISDYNISRGGYQEELKQKTKYDYFTLIIANYLQEFKKSQRKALLLFYEQVVYNTNKGDYKFFVKMQRYLCLEGEHVQMIKFMRRFLIHKLTSTWFP